MSANQCLTGGASKGVCATDKMGEGTTQHPVASGSAVTPASLFCVTPGGMMFGVAKQENVVLCCTKPYAKTRTQLFGI